MRVRVANVGDARKSVSTRGDTRESTRVLLLLTQLDSRPKSEKRMTRSTIKIACNSLFVS